MCSKSYLLSIKKRSQPPPILAAPIPTISMLRRSYPVKGSAPLPLFVAADTGGATQLIIIRANFFGNLGILFFLPRILMVGNTFESR